MARVVIVLRWGNVLLESAAWAWVMALALSVSKLLDLLIARKFLHRGFS